MNLQPSKIAQIERKFASNCNLKKHGSKKVTLLFICALKKTNHVTILTDTDTINA